MLKHLPKTIVPRKGAPREKLAYISNLEAKMLLALTDGKADMTAHGVPSFYMEGGTGTRGTSGIGTSSSGGSSRSKTSSGGGISGGSSAGVGGVGSGSGSKSPGGGGGRGGESGMRDSVGANVGNNRGGSGGGGGTQNASREAQGNVSGRPSGGGGYNSNTAAGMGRYGGVTSPTARAANSSWADTQRAANAVRGLGRMPAGPQYNGPAKYNAPFNANRSQQVFGGYPNSMAGMMPGATGFASAAPSAPIKTYDPVDSVSNLQNYLSEVAHVRKANAPAARQPVRQAAGTPTSGYNPTAQAAGTLTSPYAPQPANVAAAPDPRYNVGVMDAPRLAQDPTNGRQATLRAAPQTRAMPNSAGRYGVPGQGPLGYRSLVNAVTTIGGQPDQQIDTVLKNMGYDNPFGRAAAIGRFGHETASFDPKVFSGQRLGDEGTAYGLAQWRGDRQDAAKAYAGQMGVDPANVAGQAAFAGKELRESYPKAYGQVQSAKTIADAMLGMNRYESPRGQPQALKAGNPNLVSGYADSMNRAKQFASGQPTQVASIDPASYTTPGQNFSTGISPSALPSLANMAVSGVDALTSFRAPNIMGALNEAASYVKQYADAQPGIGISRSISQRIVAKEAKKAITNAQQAIAGWQQGTLTKVAAVEALQKAQKATVQVATVSETDPSMWEGTTPDQQASIRQDRQPTPERAKLQSAAKSIMSKFGPGGGGERGSRGLRNLPRSATPTPVQGPTPPMPGFTWVQWVPGSPPTQIPTNALIGAA